MPVALSVMLFAIPYTYAFMLMARSKNLARTAERLSGFWRVRIGFKFSL